MDARERRRRRGNPRTWTRSSCRGQEEGVSTTSSPAPSRRGGVARARVKVLGREDRLCEGERDASRVGRSARGMTRLARRWGGEGCRTEYFASSRPARARGTVAARRAVVDSFMMRRRVGREEREREASRGRRRGEYNCLAGGDFYYWPIQSGPLVPLPSRPSSRPLDTRNTQPSQRPLAQ